MVDAVKAVENGAAFQVQGWAARDSSGHLSPFSFTRRKTGAEDVTFKVVYCGICHSDLHFIKNEWGVSRYPMVPGHEMVGIVVEVGSHVKNFSVGERVGVGCLVGSCLNCHCCDKGLEQYCPKNIATYNGIDSDGSTTYGGYSHLMVCNYKFVLKIPESLPFDEAAPLLCAGITVYSPMKYFGMTKPGKRLAVVGLGGLGHMAVKFGKAFGLHVTVISTSPHKEKESRQILGADDFLISKDHKKMQEAASTFDFLIDTVSAEHAFAPLLSLLRADGKLVVVGVPPKPMEIPAAALIFEKAENWLQGVPLVELRRQEMLDFCGKHSITCVIEKISMDYVNTAMERMLKGDVKYRFVIDTELSFNSG